MSSGCDTSSPSNGRGTRRARKQRDALPAMSERQMQAYLLARDAIRRVQRVSSLVGESLARPSGMTGRGQADRNGIRGNPAPAS